MFDSAPRSYLAGLNEAQAEAVTHGRAPLLIVAGAGTGKTKTLACRVAHLLHEGVAPERILLLTFTRRAAREMLGRAARHAEPDAAARVWGGTFHATAHRLLRIHCRAVGLAPSFTVMDQGDAADLMALVRSDLGFGQGRRRFPNKDTLAAIYGRVASTLTPLEDVLDKWYPWCSDDGDGIRAVFEGYAERKRAQALVDFDDLLLFWSVLLRAPGAGAEIAASFEHVLVDEYQDTNGLQGEILRALRPSNECVTVVGDDAQAIYSFRAATVENILEFPRAFPGARVVKLEQCYRSTQPILDAANAVLAASARGFRKELWTTRDGGTRPLLTTCVDEGQQSDLVCRRVLEARERGVSLHRQAVLFRTGHHSAHLEIELARRNIPFVKFGGLRFVEAAHVKDLLALLRILENPRDELAWFRVLRLAEGVGPKTAARVMDGIGVRADARDAGASPIARLAEIAATVPAPGSCELVALARVLAECAAADDGPAADVDRLRTWCEPAFERVYSHAPARVADVEHLARLASAYTSRGRFVVDLTLDPPSATGEVAGAPHLDDDYLVLSTIHSAKGCEWDAVYVIHAADGMIPSDMATVDDEGVDEERRLFYVALTRARDTLQVFFPLRYYHRRSPHADAHGYAQLTRFLDVRARAAFDAESFEPRGDDDALRDAPGAPASVDALLAGLWGRAR
ncbi:MAG TPA: ATP-dependent helicase [Actinomycetota bacterium]|nr:ATP-dependent helicase [Actinomycetota bacterium]